MIARLTGTIADVRLLEVVIDVQGVGYLVYVTQSSGFKIGEKISLYTYLAVRENALDLYGFTDANQLSLFKELIKLPKIGPKTALQILSQATIETIVKAVETEDPTYLSKMSGIGKKSAEKIVTGLKDNLGVTSLGTGASPAQEGVAHLVEALVALGYSERDARTAAQEMPKDITDINAQIKHALRIIGGI